MRSEGSPLDLNNLPEDFTRDGKQAYEDTSTSGHRRKKNQDESNKIYECRFCSLKFCKSQALGGHMNRHRQERETETLNKARQLVYSSDHNPAVHPMPPHLGSYVAPSAAYHPPPPPPQVYPTRPVMFNGGATSTVFQPPRQPPQYHRQSCLYTSTPQRMLQTGEYYMAHGHALTGSSPTSNNTSHFYGESGGSNYTCIGAPVGIPGLAPGGRDRLDMEGGLTTPY